MYAWTGNVPSLTAIALVLVIPAISCLVILLVFGNILDYKIYVFSYTLTVLLIFQIYKNNWIFRVKIFTAFSKRTIDYSIIICSSVTFISNYFGNPIEFIAVVFPLLTILFAPGWVLLRLLENNNRVFKKGAIFLLCFTISIVITGIIFTAGSLYPIILSSITLATIYLAISIIPLFRYPPLIRNEFRDNTTQPRYEYRVFEVLLLIWILIFFIFVIMVFYPEMSKVAGLDIVRHFSFSKGFLLAPNAYESVYPWYHFLLASILGLTGASMTTFQVITGCLSFMLIFSFYIMARAYLFKIDQRAPLWATVLFSVFAGFGWLYYLEILSNDTVINLQALNLIVHGSYYDIGYAQGGWMWFWFRPVTLALIILFVLLYLLTNQKLTRNNYIIIFSLLLVAQSQIHFSEFAMFVIFVFVLTIFTPRANLRLKETSLSIIISLVTNAAMIFLYPGVFYSAGFFPYLTIGLGALGVMSYLLAGHVKRPFYFFKGHLSQKNVITATLSVLFLYLLLLTHWFLDTANFIFREVLPLYAVPWQFYPMLLGVTGICAIIAIPILIKKYRAYPITIFVIMFLLTISFGRAITYLGSESSLTGYFERRVVFLVFTAASLLAPIAIFAIVRYLERFQDMTLAKTKGLIKAVTFISFLVAIGTLSTFLSVEYQTSILDENTTADSKIEEIQKTVNKDPYSTLLTTSAQSYNIAQFASPAYVIGHWSNQIWPSKSPELPLNVMSILNSSYIYIQGNDSQIINDKYAGSYLSDHLLKQAPVSYDNNSDKIIRLPKLSPPTKYSNLVLAVPDLGNMSQLEYFAYDVLSLAGYNYTTVLESDISSLRDALIVVAPSEYIASKMIQYKNDYALQFNTLVVLNLEGHGLMWEEFTDLSSRGVSTSSSIRLDSYSDEKEIIRNSNELSLPGKIKMIPRIPQANIRQIASFEDSKVPFILEKKGDDLDIYYINIHPIVQTSAGDKSGKVYNSMHNVLNFLPVLDLPIYETTEAPRPSGLVSGGVAAFDSVLFKGNLNFSSSSAIVNILEGLPVELSVDGRKSVIEDVSRIIPAKFENLTIQGHKGGVLEKGYGFYPLFSMNQSLIRASGKPAVIELYQDGQSDPTTSVTGEEIQLKISKSNTLLRQPNIVSNGVADFKGFYAYGELYNKIPALGQDFNMKGKSSFEVDYSDEFIVVSSASFQGEIPHRQLAYAYDELGSLSKIFSLSYLRYLIPLLVLLVVIFLYFLDKEQIAC